MTLHRLGRVSQDPVDTSHRAMTTLPWAETTRAALARYRDEQPEPEELARVAAYTASPREYFDDPHLRVRAIENELAHAFRTVWDALEQTLDPDDVRRVAHAAGRIHGRRRLGTFLAGLGTSGGPEAMARWQDTAHASAGARHTTALFARYDDEMVEVVRTEDSFGTSGDESPASLAFFDGFIDGYESVDPRLHTVEELERDGPDGRVEFVHRFWFRPAGTATEVAQRPDADRASAQKSA